MFKSSAPVSVELSSIKLKPWPLGIFYVQSELSGLCLDAKGEARKPGTEAIVWSKKDSPNQQWSFESGGIIRNVMNGLVLDVRDPKGKCPQLVCWPFENKSNQKWLWDGKHLISQYDSTVGNKQVRVADIKGESKAKGTQVITWEIKPLEAKMRSLNQEWKLIPVQQKSSP